MRGWTLVVSIVVHLGIIVAPLLATVDLPALPRATEYVLVSARMPSPPPEQRPVTPARTVSAAPSVVAPDHVAPEPAAPAPRPTDFDTIGGDPLAGPFVPSGVVSGGDPLPAPPPPAPAPKPIYRVGGDIRPPQKIRDAAPRYPALALASKVEGLVILEAEIAEDGTVQNVTVLRGNPLLDDAAVEAVRQWRFTPTRLNGEAVPVVITVTVSFSLH